MNSTMSLAELIRLPFTETITPPNGNPARAAGDPCPNPGDHRAQRSPLPKNAGA